jgi:hypothetical protein
MSTTHLTIHDLLRITYTYEAQAWQAQPQMRKKRSDSACFVRYTLSTFSTIGNANDTAA